MKGAFLLIMLLLGILIVVCASSAKEHYFSIDPIDTGVERPLWGPLYTLPRQDNRYLTIHETPYCVDPLKEEGMCARAWCSARVSPGTAVGVDCGPEIPYEFDKI